MTDRIISEEMFQMVFNYIHQQSTPKIMSVAEVEVILGHMQKLPEAEQAGPKPAGKTGVSE